MSLATEKTERSTTPTKVNVAPLVIAGLVTSAAVAGAVLGKLKGMAIGVVLSAIGSVVVGMNPKLGDAIVSGAVKLTSNRGGKKLASVGKRLSDRLDQYTQFRETFPDKAGEKTEAWLRQSWLKDNELMVKGISKGVRNGFQSYLKFRFIFEGAIGGIAWLTYRDRPTVGKRAIDMAGGFVAGSLMEVPYQVVGQILDEYTQALKRQHSQELELAPSPI
jgi:hypothetical protein